MTAGQHPQRWPFHIRDEDFFEFTEWLSKHDEQIREQERARVLDAIRGTDASCCPHEMCHSGEGHDGLNCRDCLIKFIEESLRQPGAGELQP